MFHHVRGTPPMAFLQELLLEDKSLLIAYGGKKGGGRGEGGC